MRRGNGSVLGEHPGGDGDAANTSPVDWSRMEPGDHFVQFHESEEFLLEALSGYIGLGLQNDEAGIVIATEAHRAALEARLAAAGVDLENARASGRYIALDAAETLARIMDGDQPSPRRFRKVIGDVLSRASSPGGNIRAFGEMVALLWQDGLQSAAIELEELWNELAKEHTFTLFCAYPLAEFADQSYAEPFQHICRRHARVIPSESYSALTHERDRDREIALLQQKALALESEVKARRAAERKRIERERELSDFLESAVEGIHRVGADGTILWANAAELALLGYTPEEYIGRSIREFHVDEAAIEDILDRLCRGETLYNYPARLRASDGSIRHVLIHSNGRWEEGRFRYTRCFTRDVTDLKRAQDERDRVLERERAARRELELANDDLRDFAYIVSHDLKEPLRGISNYTSFLLKDHAEALGQEGVPKVETIKRLARRSYDLLDAVLAFSRIGRERMKVQDVEVERLFARAFDNVRGRMDDDGALVTFEPTPMIMRCDPDLALQVLTNLITNGLKYNDSSPKRVEVACREGPHGQPIISVRDNGIGIEPRHRERIFRMFKRLHGRERYGGGTGAGLAIVRRIIGRHGGWISVKSRPGEGSTFHFTLEMSPGAAALEE